MQWIDAGDRMPEKVDGDPDGDVLVRSKWNGQSYVLTRKWHEVQLGDEWLEGAFADIPSPNGRGNHSVGPDYSTLGGLE